MKKLFVPVFSLIAGLAAGWFGHQWRQPPFAAVAAGVGSSSAAPLPAAVISSPAAGPVDAIATAKTPQEKVTTAAKASVTAFRDLLKQEPNKARANAKILAMLDAMDAASITALARQVNDTPMDWYDGQSSALGQLVYGKLAEIDPARALVMAMGAKDIWSRMNTAGTVIEHLARTNPAAAEAAALKLPQGYMRREVTFRLASTLAQSDGPGAVALMQRMKVPPNDYTWGALYAAWAGSDPAAASASLLTMPRQVALNSMRSIAGAWARRDSVAAMAWAQSLAEPSLRSAAMGSTITAIAQTNPQRATELASAQPVGERRTLLTGIVSTMAQADGQGAIAWAKNLTDPVERQRCMASIVNSTGYSDATAAKEALALLTPGALRNQALEQISGNMSWIDPQGTKDWALSLKPNEQALVLRQVIGTLAQLDTGEAEKLASALPPSGNNGWAWSSIASSKALKDPVEALTWAGSLDTEQARLASTGMVFEQWAEHSPEKAAEALPGISDANQRRAATEKLASSWAARSPAEAERWASGLTGEDRITALSAVWNASATDDPQRAGRSLAAISSEAGSDTAVDKLSASAASIAGAWTGQNPADAAAWAGTLPDGKLREEALGKVAGEWAKYDPEAVSVWINQLPHDRSRDMAIGQLVSQIASTDPESAFTWATSADSGEKQIEILKSAATAWKAQNPEAARAAVQSSTLPADVKARVMEAIR